MKKNKQTENTSVCSNEHSKLTIENNSICSNMTTEDITSSNEKTMNKLLKKKLKSPKKETKQHSDLSESTGYEQCEVTKNKKKHKDISSKINMNIDDTSSNLTHNAANESKESNISEELNSQLKLKSEKNVNKNIIVSQDMFEDSSNEMDVSNCSISSSEKFIPLNQEAESLYITKRKRKLENDSPKKKSKKHKTRDNSIIDTKIDGEHEIFSSNEVMLKEEESDKKEKHHSNMKNKRKAQDIQMKESSEMDTSCYEITIKTDSPKKKSKKHKTLDSENDNENGTIKIEVAEKDLSSEERNGQAHSLSDFENIYVKKKRKLHLKEKARDEEKCPNDSSSSSIIDELMEKLDTIESVSEKRTSPIKKHVKKIIEKSSKAKDCETDNENESTKSEVAVKNLCGGGGNDETSSLSDFEIFHVEKKRKLHSKEVARGNEKCRKNSTSSIVNGLLKKLNAINSTREKKKSPIKKKTKPIIETSTNEEAGEISDEEKGKKKNLIVDKQAAKSSTSLKADEVDNEANVSLIPDSVLDNLLLKFDEIVQEDKDKNSKTKNLENGPIQEININEPTEIHEEATPGDEGVASRDKEAASVDQAVASGVEKKKKIIELMKNTKMTVEKLKKELDIKIDFEMLDQLKCIDIKIPCSLPRIHKIATSVSNGPTPEQRDALEKLGIKIKLGKYTKEEDEKINNNWLLFCKQYKWDKDNPELFLKGSKRSIHGVIPIETFKKFVQFISHNFEDRMMYNIYSRFQRLYSEKVDKYFTPEDDAIIIEYMNKSNVSRPYADIAVLLKRPRLSILKRYKQIQTEKSFDNRKINWDKYSVKQLLNNLLKVTGSKRVSDLKGRHITTKQWEKIAKEMDIPTSKLKRVWVMDVYTRLLNPDYDEECSNVRNELLEILSKKYNDWREVDWNKLAKKFDSYTPQRLYKMFCDVVRSKVPKDQQKDLKAAVEYLKENPPIKRKNRFRYINEILEELEEEENPDSHRSKRSEGKSAQ